jgi:hypothetical protein
MREEHPPFTIFSLYDILFLRYSLFTTFSLYDILSLRYPPFTTFSFYNILFSRYLSFTTFSFHDILLSRHFSFTTSYFHSFPRDHLIARRFYVAKALAFKKKIGEDYSRLDNLANAYVTVANDTGIIIRPERLYL